MCPPIKPPINHLENAAQCKYKELNSAMWTGLTLYMRGSAIALAVIGFALGYLFRVPLEIFYARILCGCVLVVIAFWYLGSLFSISHYNSLLQSIKETEQLMSLSFTHRNYRICKVIVFSAMGCMIPITGVFIFLLFKPPSVVPGNPLF